MGISSMRAVNQGWALLQHSLAFAKHPVRSLTQKQLLLLLLLLLPSSTLRRCSSGTGSMVACDIFARVRVDGVIVCRMIQRTGWCHPSLLSSVLEGGACTLLAADSSQSLPSGAFGLTETTPRHLLRLKV
ncbi:unnamed protein product [Durusdinium trenchii]|uniref:Secreted protein n=1 Tax=Durusdinium trenchii TaxID=1381693 RepID=A0ABP0NTV6_9DINO